MKPYHPAGVAISPEKERTHFLLRDMRGVPNVKVPSVEPLLVVSAEDFRQMVRQNRIQLFMESADGSIVNVYTEEECKVFKMTRRKVEITTENYFKGENTILDTYLDRRGALNIGLVMCRVMSIVKQAMVTGAIYCRGMSDNDFEIIKGNSLLAVRQSPDFAICNWMLSQLQDIMRIFSGRPMTCCTLPMSYTDNPLYQVKMMGFRPPTIEEIEDTRDAIESSVLRYSNEGSTFGAHQGGLTSMHLK